MTRSDSLSNTEREERKRETYALPRPPGGAPVSPSAMTWAETEKALAEDSAGRVSLVKDWRSIFADVSGKILRNRREF